ncbi:CcdB family protein [Pseudoroseicyclus sp. CXY001]|uniref:CcdB family protein n=1 Tax=Pseudoroseicyclus sp. CXY001 TaxID=3242492 RepID=UPI0035713284
MAQFDVYRLPGVGLVLDLQTDLLDLPPRVVAPLIPAGEGPRPLTRLEPVIEIDGRGHVLHTAEMAAVPRHILKGEPVASGAAEADAIRRALDMVFSGF